MSKRPPTGSWIVWLVALALAVWIVWSFPASAQSRLILAPEVVVIIDPPEVLACDRPGWIVSTADGDILAAHASGQLLPAGLIITPAAEGRIYCGGFEL